MLPGQRIRRIADFENQRRFIALDLLYGVPVRDDVRAYLIDNGMPGDEYGWFMSRGREASDPRARLLRVEREADQQRRPPERSSASCSAGMSSRSNTSSATGGP